MKSIASFVAGLTVASVLFSALALFAQSDSLSLTQPWVINISQSIPVLADVALSTEEGVLTSTLPLTVDVALQVRIAGPLSITLASETTPTVTVAQPSIGQEQNDDLGLTYTLDINSPDLSITEWTAYESSNGWLEFSGEVALAADTDPITDIDCVMRLYKAGKLVKVAEIFNVGFQLDPGGTNRFTGDPTVQPEDVDSYTVTFKVIR